ncbi:hypothetical protein [Pedobacter cryoconitis]|nr:hypothetical protein [Pedobacter cryoconitis]MBB5644208.1 hypothetical protein [Pedobacter cryoconitis]
MKAIMKSGDKSRLNIYNLKGKCSVIGGYSFLFFYFVKFDFEIGTD